MYNTSYITYKEDTNMAISKQDIIEAAEKLQVAGVNPTMQAIRDALGGGSFATISPVLREWRNASGQRATVAIEMPGEAKAALERAGVDLWKIITTLATEKLTKVQDEAEAAINAAQADRDEALAEIERLEAGIEQQGGELAEALAANEVSTNALNRALDENRALEIQLADKTRIEADNTRLTAELAELRTENKALVDDKFVLIGQMKDVESKLAAMAGVEEEAKRLSAELAELRTENKVLVDEKFVLVGSVKDAESRLLRTENALSSVEKELVKVTEQLKEKDAQTGKLQAENNIYNLQTQKLQIALDASETKAAEVKTEVAELRKTIGDREREAGALAWELKAVTAENKELKAFKKGK
jgi:chromosome segregation ATPase